MAKNNRDGGQSSAKRSLHRRIRGDRLVRFLLVMGTVDAVLGGLFSHGVLVGIGLVAMGVDIALRRAAAQQAALAESSEK